MQQLLPVARTQNLIIKELPDETLIYDLESDQAHCLNLTAALAWKNCDGSHSIADLTQLLIVRLGVDVAEDVVWLALGQLGKFDLLLQSPAAPHAADLTRRQLARHLGLAALSLPLIASICSPTAAQSASPELRGASSDCCQ